MNILLQLHPKRKTPSCKGWPIAGHTPAECCRPFWAAIDKLLAARKNLLRKQRGRK